VGDRALLRGTWCVFSISRRCQPVFRPDLPGPEAGPRDRRQVVQQRPEERERGAEELPHLSPGAEQGHCY
jgi:hypothetical protein